MPLNPIVSACMSSEYNGDGRVVSDVYSLYIRRVLLVSGTSTRLLHSRRNKLGYDKAVHLAQEGDAFVGGTDGKSCRSTLSGARYAVSDVTLTANQILSWDRDFDAAQPGVGLKKVPMNSATVSVRMVGLSQSLV